MNQEPGSGTPREYGPPITPPPTPPGAVGLYEQPQPPPPPRRRGMPWWGWLLSGCGGCAIVSVIALVAVTWLGVNMAQKAVKDLGPVDQKTVQKNLGEVPLYPGVVINEMTTQAVMLGFRTMEKGNGKPPGSILKALAIGDSKDAPEKVLKFYQQKLKAKGWTEKETGGVSSVNSKRRDFTTHEFTKGKEVVLILVEPRSNGTRVSVMRGGADLTDQTLKQK